jgi:16S rRNA (adenine1518-N6/adenine1519-N6)-dimethyltransferase
VEIDTNLIKVLNERFSDRSKYSFIHQDFLEFDLMNSIEKPSDHSKIILGNIPYNITSPILFKLFDHADFLDQAVLMVQKEVGSRITAKEGRKVYGLLSIFSQLFAEVDYLFSVQAKLFFPKPKVDSAVIKFNFHKKVKEEFEDFELFRQMVRTCFQHRRKMLRNSLRHLYSDEVLSKLSGSLSLRPEQLSIPDWKELFRSIYNLSNKVDFK